MSEKSEEKKGVEVQKGKPPAPTRAINALIGEEEQNEKQKKEQKERNRERAPNPATFHHSVTPNDPQGSYDELILNLVEPPEKTFINSFITLHNCLICAFGTL